MTPFKNVSLKAIEGKSIQQVNTSWKRFVNEKVSPIKIYDFYKSHDN